MIRVFAKILIMLLCVFVCTSCDFLTKSLGTEFFGKDLSWSYEDRFSKIQATSTLISLSNDASILRDSKACVSLMNEIAKRYNLDNSCIAGLSVEQQNNLLNLYVTSIFPLNKIASSLSSISNQNPTDEQIHIIDNLISIVRQVDSVTTCDLLGQVSVLNKCDVTTLLISSVALMTNIIATESVLEDRVPSEQFIKIRDYIVNLPMNTDASDAVLYAVNDDIISKDSSDALERVIDVVLVLSGKSTLKDQYGNIIDRSDDVSAVQIGDFNLGDIFDLEVKEKLPEDSDKKEDENSDKNFVEENLENSFFYQSDLSILNLQGGKI